MKRIVNANTLTLVYLDGPRNLLNCCYDIGWHFIPTSARSGCFGT
jgi:hypothetical protein